MAASSHNVTRTANRRCGKAKAPGGGQAGSASRGTPTGAILEAFNHSRDRQLP